MAKIHTHYDNLKVARAAPPEVIRAAYKALSQKYHPDKNPGDDKAARIMAIINSAYGTLADPQRRKEHDDWIAAEEWESEWVDHADQEAQRKRRQEARAKGGKDDKGKAARPLRRWLWWCGMVACFGLGWLAGALIPGKLKPLSGLVWGVAAEAGPKPELGLPLRAAPAVPKAAVADSAAAQPSPPEAVPADMRIMAVSQLTLPPVAPVCDGAAPAPFAPNGAPWPRESGYVEGFPLGNKGDDLQLLLDNAANVAPVFIKLYDLERRANVRYLFILPHDKLTVEQLAFGKYEVRYQKVDLGGKDGCGPVKAGRKGGAVQRAAADAL